ncbi:MAG: glycosyltransferase family 4 protein [Planctomycetota bacterium]
MLGGAERCLLDLMASLRQTVPDIEIHLVTGAEGPLLAQAEEFGAQTTVLPMPTAFEQLGDSALRGGRGRIVRFGLSAPAALWAAWRYRRQLGRLLAELRPDVVHSNSIKFHLLTRKSAGPLVVWYVHDFLGARAVAAKMLRWTQGVDGCVAVSRAVAQDAQAVLPGVPVEVVYNAIDVDHFRPGPSALSLDALAGLPVADPSIVRVGLVATYARWKGQDIFLRAAAQLTQQLRPGTARFFIVGGPIYQTLGSQWSRDELRALAKAVGAAEVGFIDFQDDPRDVYRALDIVVHASTRPEPFGRTVVEAMACGRAVIVTQAGGAAELFTEGHDAMGVSAGDPVGLAEKLQELIGNPQRRAELGANGRRSAEVRFARSRLGEQILTAYNSFRTNKFGA